MTASPRCLHTTCVSPLSSPPRAHTHIPRPHLHTHTRTQAQALALKKANAKPLTAFMLYSSRNRAAIKAANPEAKLTQVSSLLGKAWNELPEEQRATYKEQAASELAAWKAKQGAASA